MSARTLTVRVSFHAKIRLPIDVVLITSPRQGVFSIRLCGISPKLGELLGVLADLPPLGNFDSAADAHDAAWQWAELFGIFAIYDFDVEMGQGE